MDPMTGKVEVNVHRQIWGNLNKEQKHLQFTSSYNYLNQFQQDHKDATAGYDVWSEVLSLSKVGAFV